MDWLNNPAAAMEEFRKFLRTQGYEKSIEKFSKCSKRRLKEQTEEHNGGSYWIGTPSYLHHVVVSVLGRTFPA